MVSPNRGPLKLLQVPPVRKDSEFNALSPWHTAVTRSKRQAFAQSLNWEARDYTRLITTGYLFRATSSGLRPLRNGLRAEVQVLPDVANPYSSAPRL